MSKDPHAKRESRKYTQPIASREYILEQLTEVGEPLSRRQLNELLNLHEAEEREALRRRLRAMERDGQVIRNRRGAYAPVGSLHLIRGRVIGHQDGFGFLKPDEGGDDLFINARVMRCLLHGDRAVVRVAGIDRRGRREAALVEVLERGNHQVVGRFHDDSGVGIVVPDNKRIHLDILIPAGQYGGAKDGQIVIAEITEQPGKHNQPVGKIIETMGEHMAPGMEVDIAIRTHELPCDWPQDVVDEAGAIPDQIPAAEIAEREDLRKLPLVTIDGEDARDFDDAVWCEPAGEGWRLIVAIADVSFYVRPGQPLDDEAHKRGTSVYFPNRVIPMLPEKLSNGLCSINPDVDRLCMVCDMQIATDGSVASSRFYPAVMRSAARLTYTQVAAFWDGDSDLPQGREHLAEHIQDLHRLYKVLRERRELRGAIDFDTTETRMLFDDNGKIERIVPVVRNDAHKMIEECMVAANVEAAHFVANAQIPALFRIHEEPSGDKITDLRIFLKSMGLTLGGGDRPKPGDYSVLLASVQDRPDVCLIQTVMLRSLRLAVYSPENAGHFGLSYDAYAHFTSPIRRYPDLLLHRAIRHFVAGRKPGKFEYTASRMVELGEHCSMTERRADDASRDAEAWLKCEYMLEKIGETFSGLVTGVTAFGLFIELDDIHVEGLVHVTALSNDYYDYDPKAHTLRGERGGKVYRLADRLTVKVLSVSLDTRKIDFELEDTRKRRRTLRRRTR